MFKFKNQTSGRIEAAQTPSWYYQQDSWGFPEFSNCIAHYSLGIPDVLSSRRQSLISSHPATLPTPLADSSSISPILEIHPNLHRCPSNTSDLGTRNTGLAESSSIPRSGIIKPPLKQDIVLTRIVDAERDAAIGGVEKTDGK
jgi:hypothetical protein